MSENEAKKYMQIEKECINRDCDRNCAKCDIVQKVGDLNSAYDTAINALEEIQKYRAIGTLEECRAAVEKQTAKRPDYEGDGYADGQLVYDTWICPCCGKHYEVDYDNYDYCPYCGQKLNWRDEE